MRITNIKDMRRALLAWYDETRRDLPWRRTGDPYKIWISEVMLQQTQVKTVVPYYLRFIETFPTLKHLALAKQQDVLKIWEGLGYYSRARNLHQAAGIVVEQFNEIVPDNWKSIRKLPGIGDYIAAAVLSIAYNQPYAVVDGNVKRVMARLLKIDAPVNHSTFSKTFHIAAAKLLDTKSPGKFNQAVMELGALICKPVNPYCGKCPLQVYCRAFKSATVDVYPKRMKAKPIPMYRLAAGVVCKGNRVLITQRRNDGLLGGLWEFPGGKINESETAEDACRRSIKAEVALQVKIQRFLTRVTHAYTHFRITLDVYICDHQAGRVSLNGPVNHRWVTLDEIDDFPFHKANLKFIPMLRKALKNRR